MGIGSIVFDAQWEGFTEARCSLRVGRDIVGRCLCGSFATTRMDTEQGVYEATVASVKLKKSDWPARESPHGKKIEFVRVGETQWRVCRVAGVSETDGIYSLTLEAEFA
jgi:hypothetical protein